MCTLEQKEQEYLEYSSLHNSIMLMSKKRRLELSVKKWKGGMDSLFYFDRCFFALFCPISGTYSSLNSIINSFTNCTLLYVLHVKIKR